MSTVELHLQQARRAADQLLDRAQPPVVVHVRTLAFGAWTLFLASLAGGFAFRIWEVASL